MWRFVVTTRASRTVSRRPLFPGRVLALPFLALSSLVAFPAAGQEPEPEAAQPASATDIAVAPHWSPYQAPASYPEGTELHIIQRGDTLWDISNTYLRNPFLWPQLWDANRYIENPHLIYPGDPVRIPDVDVVRGEGEEPGAPGGEPGAGPGEAGARRLGTWSGMAGQPEETVRVPSAYEEVSIQCTLSRKEADDDFRIFGEDGHGVATGDTLLESVPGGRSAGGVLHQRKVDLTRQAETTSGPIRLRILAVQEETAMAEIVQACLDINVNDYLTPFEPIPVPLLPVEDHDGSEDALNSYDFRRFTTCFTVPRRLRS
jgi:hypothetical protein